MKILRAGAAVFKPLLDPLRLCLGLRVPERLRQRLGWSAIPSCRDLLGSLTELPAMQEVQPAELPAVQEVQAVPLDNVRALLESKGLREFPTWGHGDCLHNSLHVCLFETDTWTQQQRDAHLEWLLASDERALGAAYWQASALPGTGTAVPGEAEGSWVMPDNPEVWPQNRNDPDVRRRVTRMRRRVQQQRDIMADIAMKELSFLKERWWLQDDALLDQIKQSRTLGVFELAVMEMYPALLSKYLGVQLAVVVDAAHPYVTQQAPALAEDDPFASPPAHPEITFVKRPEPHTHFNATKHLQPRGDPPAQDPPTSASDDPDDKEQLFFIIMEGDQVAVSSQCH